MLMGSLYRSNASSSCVPFYLIIVFFIGSTSSDLSDSNRHVLQRLLLSVTSGCCSSGLA